MESTSIWQVFPTQNKVVSKLSNTIDCSPIVGQLLLNRTVSSIKEAQAFFSDEWHDWTPLPNQQLLIDIIKEQLKKDAAFCIYGDYDVDGVTSTAMLVDILRKQSQKVDYISPHRFNDGYGLNMKRMNEIITKKYDVLITLDCGISNVAEIAELKKANPNIIVLIIDHHKCPEELPIADAIVNPQMATPEHPAYYLCSAALVDYIFRTTPLNNINPDEYLDLTAIGLVADIMPLTKLNRWYVKRGLEAIKQSPRQAILELCISARVNHQTLSTHDIGFSIGPRLNAPGRLGDPKPIVELLLSKDERAIQQQIQTIEQLNNKRRSIGERIQSEIDEQINQNTTIREEKGIIISAECWHMGIIGINASKLVNKYHKPAVVIGFESDVARGSARSIPGVNIYNILSKCSPVLHHFGGHSQAAGFSLDPTKIMEFKEMFIKNCKSIDESETIPRLKIDAELNFSNITLQKIDEIDQLAPFGEGNPRPVFYTKASILEARKVGQSKTHIKFRFTQDRNVLDGIGFNLASKMDQIDTQDVWIAFSISKNEFRGSITPQLEVIDIKK